MAGNRRKSLSPKVGFFFPETASERDSDAKSQLSMSRNPWIELYSLVGVGLAEKLSFFEIFGTW
jgi:hypothetical protein